MLPCYFAARQSLWPKVPCRASTQTRYCEIMKNVTVSVDLETYRRARLYAAQHGASLSALVRDYLNALGTRETETERSKRLEAELRAGISSFRAGDRLPREALLARNE